MESKKIKIIGFSLVGITGFLYILIGMLRWINLGFQLPADLEYVGYVALVCLCLLTCVHLWSRLGEFQEGASIRMLFTLMGTSFFTISFIFFYYIIDAWLRWSGSLSISQLIDGAIPQVQFPLFGIEAVTIRMPLSSIVTFAFIMLGVSFFIFPLEKFVKTRRPWFAISMWLCIAVIPIFAIFRDSMILLSIATSGIVLFVLVNFIFMFYLYISLAKMSAGRMRMASVLVAIGLFSMIFVWVMGLGLFEDKVLQNVVQFGIGIGSLTLFNTGFYIMRS